jgi:hypothetical protein
VGYFFFVVDSLGVLNTDCVTFGAARSPSNTKCPSGSLQRAFRRPRLAIFVCRAIHILTMATTPAADAAATYHTAVDLQDTTNTAPPIVATSVAASWRSNIRRKRCVDAPTPSPQKKQCECGDADSETPLIPPPLQKEPSTPVVDQCDNGVGLRLIDVCSLQKGLEHLCCRKCSEENLKTMIDKQMRSFLVFHNKRLDFSKKHKKTGPLVDNTYKIFK